MTLALAVACGDDSAVQPPPTTGTPPSTEECPALFAECDGYVETVCEARLDTPEHCGGCNQACPTGDPAKGEIATCDGTVCGLACGPGYEDCNGDLADGCEVDIETDPAHCGGCGAEFACGPGVECVLGTCGCAVLVDNLPRRPFSVAVDPEPGGFVYWSLRGSATDGGVQRAPKAGGKAETIVGGQGSVEAIALWGNELYWVTETGDGSTAAVRSVPKDSDEATTWTEYATGFVPNYNQASTLAVDGTFLFWSAISGNDGLLMRVPRDASEAPVVLTSFVGTDTSLEVGDIATSDGTVFFTGPYTQTIHRIDSEASAGSSSTLLAEEQSGPVGIAVHDDYVYWCNVDDVTQLDLETLRTAVVAASSDTPEFPLYVAADAEAAYFTSETGSQYGSVLQGVRIADGDVVTLAAAQPGVADLALDDEFVYWTTQGTEAAGNWSGGAIHRCPKLR